MRKTGKTISCRVEADKIEALDSIATAQDRTRSNIISEAIGNYIALRQYQDFLVHRGFADLRKGRIVKHGEVLKRLKKTGRASR